VYLSWLVSFMKHEIFDDEGRRFFSLQLKRLLVVKRKYYFLFYFEIPRSKKFRVAAL
jgi:hypothetical protein